MKKEFFNRIEKETYTSRNAARNWQDLILANVQVKGKRAADIGSGGGIYSIALADMGASSVVGVDISENMIAGARENCREYENIRFQVGTSQASNLPSGSVDLVLERALIHHLAVEQLPECFKEARRILADDGIFIIQDRTVEDCRLEGSTEHIRGIFFEAFPELMEKDTSRRHSVVTVNQYLKEAGFESIEAVTFWENRKTYQTIEELRQEIISRKGRSILYELGDEQIIELADQVARRVEGAFPLQEKERWTIWFAKVPSLTSSSVPGTKK